MKRLHSQTGFTLIELILALAIFNFVLLIVVVGYLNIVKIYENGIAARDAQQNARYGLEEISRLARNDSSYVVTHAANGDRLCLYGSQSYDLFYVNVADNRLHHAVLSPNADTSQCGLGYIATDAAISSSDVIVPIFLINKGLSPLKPNAFTIDIAMAAANAVLTGTQDCDPTAGGSQFCSVTKLHSAIDLRGQP